MDDAHQFLADAVGKLASSEDWTRMLALSRRLPSYSPLNCLLLATQGAQGMVMGYQAWKSIPDIDGKPCQVKRGAKGLKILAPSTRAVEETDDSTGQTQTVRRVVGFRLISVFDQAALVSPPAVPDAAATEPELLLGDAPQRLWDGLVEQVAAAGYRLITDAETAQAILPANGLTDFTGLFVCVRPDLAPAQRVKTLAHELGHVHLHAPNVRPEGLARDRGEVEAESVAFLVTDALGLDSSAYSIPYVTGWAGGDVELILATAQRAITTARTISDTLHRYLAGLDLPPGAAEPTTKSPEPPDGATATADTDIRIDVESGWTELPAPAQRAPAARRVGAEPTADDSRGPASTNGRLRHVDAVGLETVLGAWEIYWDPSLASFTAHHHPHGQPRAASRAMTVGVSTAEIPNLGTLETRLGFPLPHSLRDHLTHVAALASTSRAAQPQTPPAPTQEPARVGSRGLPRPTHFGQVHVPGRPDRTYHAALLDQPPLRTWNSTDTHPQHIERRGHTGGGYRVEILATTPTAASSGTPRQALTYRLSHDDDVVFSGDDVLAPPETDPASDEAIRQVILLLTHPDPDIPLTPTQHQFLRHHTDQLRDLLQPAAEPYPAGTRILVTGSSNSNDTSGQETTPPAAGTIATGTVAHATVREDGTVTSYAWRPDVANLPGHPWLDNPALVLVTRADCVRPTLTGPDTGLTGWSPDLPLGYGARVTFAADDGHEVTATVLRAHLTPDDGISYDLRLDPINPALGPSPSPSPVIRLPADQVRPRLGTAWPALHDVITARTAHNIDLQAGELLTAAGQIAYVADSPDGPTLTRLLSTSLHADGDHATPAHLPRVDAPEPCATPDCSGTAQMTLVIAWPQNRREITQRCRPCAGRVAAARLGRSCTVNIQPLHPSADLDAALPDTADVVPAAATPEAAL